MADEAKQRKAAVWTDGDRVSLLTSVLSRMEGVMVTAVGGPRRSSAAEMADAFGSACVDDLRGLLIEHTPDDLLLGTSMGGEMLRLARQQGVRVLAVEPAVADTASAEAGGEASWHPLPWWRLSPAYVSAAEPMQVIGRLRSVSLVCGGPAKCGSLYALLYDAMDMTIDLLGTPETVDACLTGPLTATPDDLRALTGHLTAHLRLNRQASMAMHVSDRCARRFRQLLVIGDEGQLMMTDAGYRLWNAAGELVDESAGPAASPDVADLCVRQWRGMIDHPASLPAGADPRAVIACCQTSLLSARTGEQESPDAMMRMRGV